MPNRMKILFLCTGNSCRSQMAEGLARHIVGDRVEAFSAGTLPQKVNPFAVKVMEEIGVDITHHFSKSIDSLRAYSFDLVITVCDDAHEQCPVWLGRGKVIHHSFDDPPKLALSATTEAEALVSYRRVRDEIRSYIEILSKSEIIK